jgi:hypothetical protein
MKGFITKNTLRLGLSGICLVSLIGCYHYRELVDPCWPERYNSMARVGVRTIPFAQADKGHLLEQTVWNWHFEPDKNGAASDHLSGAGMAVLSRIARTLPAPDLQLYLQNAQDIPYTDAVAPDKLVAQRDQMNKRRIDSILRYMSTQTPSGGSGAFQVAVHDFGPTSVPGDWPSYSLFKVEQNLKNGVPQFFQAPQYNTK